MKRIILALAATTALALTACGSGTSAPETPAPTTSQAAQTKTAEPTPATEDTTESFEPMTAEELEATGEPMDGGPTTKADAQSMDDYEECVADLKADYEPDMGMTNDTSICDDILLMNQEMDYQIDLMEGLDVPCMLQLETERPNLFEGRLLEDIVEDRAVIQECGE